MAEGGQDKDKPIEPKEIPPEFQAVIDAFSKMGVKPKADTPEDLNQWMLEYLRTSGLIAKEDIKPPLQAPPIQQQKEEKPHRMSMTHPPRITWFSGSEPQSGETTFELWKHEVRCLLGQSYEREAILNAIRRSLRGEAGYVALRLPLDVTVEEILAKLDSIYGSVDKKEELLAEFYGSRQREDETVTSWSCRLEGILGKAVERGLVNRKDIDGMLHSMLWTGLKSSLKDISGYKYDTVKDFDGLRVALRQIENDHCHRELPKPTKPQTSKSAARPTEMDELKGMINQISTRLETYERKFDQPPQQQNQSWQRQPQQSWSNQAPGQQRQQPQWRNQYRGRGIARGGSTNSNSSYREQGAEYQDKEYKCWRCGQLGHLRRGCKVRLDHSRADLNARKPMQRERP